jgi:hypothetical protein
VGVAIGARKAVVTSIKSQRLEWILLPTIVAFVELNVERRHVVVVQVVPQMIRQLQQ